MGVLALQYFPPQASATESMIVLLGRSIE